MPRAFADLEYEILAHEPNQPPLIAIVGTGSNGDPFTWRMRGTGDVDYLIRRLREIRGIMILKQAANKPALRSQLPVKGSKRSFK